MSERTIEELLAVYRAAYCEHGLLPSEPGESACEAHGARALYELGRADAREQDRATLARVEAERDEFRERLRHQGQLSCTLVEQNALVITRMSQLDNENAELRAALAPQADAEREGGER